MLHATFKKSINMKDNYSLTMSTKTIFAILLLVILAIACTPIAPPTPSGQQAVKLDYSVSGCDTKDGGMKRAPAELVDVDIAGNNVKLVHHLNYVCCAKIKVNLEGIETITPDGTSIIIAEKNEGEMCRCMCNYDVGINLGPLAKGKYTVQIFGIVYKDMPIEKLWEKELIIGEEAALPQPKEGFCGTSTNGECSADSDCTSGGCSGQVCQSKSEEPMITTCEYRDCYNAEEYGVKCSCVTGTCAWK